MVCLSVLTSGVVRECDFHPGWLCGKGYLWWGVDCHIHRLEKNNVSLSIYKIYILSLPLSGWVTGLTTEPQKAEVGPGNEIKMSKETQSKLETLRCQLYVLEPFKMTNNVIQGQWFIVHRSSFFQGRAGAATGQSPTGTWAVPTNIPVKHCSLWGPHLQHQWQVHSMSRWCQLQPHSWGADCHRQSAASGVLVILLALGYKCRMSNQAWKI